MTLGELRSKYRDSILSLAEKRHADNVRIFGSIANGSAGSDSDSDSDIDFLVHLDKKADLADWSGLKIDLEKLIGTKVDVIPDSSLHKVIKEQVLSEAVLL
jgi:predicted nucleotidyltransferase